MKIEKEELLSFEFTKKIFNVVLKSQFEKKLKIVLNSKIKDQPLLQMGKYKM